MYVLFHNFLHISSKDYVSNTLQADEEQVDFWGDQDAEIIAFHILMQALYGHPLRIRSIPKLRHIIRLADYYRALPQLSTAFSESLELGSCPRILEGIVQNCVELLEIAAEL